MKKEPWRIIVGIISIVFIMGMWMKKGISIDMSLPLLVTTLTVTFSKVLLFVGIILFVRIILTKLKK